MEFTQNLDSLIPLFKTQKCSITRFLEKHFKENVHYIKYKSILTNNDLSKKHGGQNKIEYLLTDETFELMKSSYNLKHRYITKIKNSNHVNIIMTLENQTIGFIENTFKDVIETKRQFSFKNENNLYKVDLYFPTYKLIIECDEYNHIDRDKNYEYEREQFLLSLENTIIRYNPNDNNFDLSIVINLINKHLFCKEKKDSICIIVNF